MSGLSVVKDCPDKFSNLVIMNTALPIGAWATDDMGDPHYEKPPFYVAISRVESFHLILNKNNIYLTIFPGSSLHPVAVDGSVVWDESSDR